MWLINEINKPWMPPRVSWRKNAIAHVAAYIWSSLRACKVGQEEKRGVGAELPWASGLSADLKCSYRSGWQATVGETCCLHGQLGDPNELLVGPFRTWLQTRWTSSIPSCRSLSTLSTTIPPCRVYPIVSDAGEVQRERPGKSSQEYLVGHSVKQDAGLDGPFLAWASSMAAPTFLNLAPTSSLQVL